MPTPFEPGARAPAGFIPLSEPVLRGREGEYVGSCITTGWVSSVGAFVDRFEHDLAAYLAMPHAVATVNGTAALHVALLLVGVEPGDEVLVPTLTFVAPVNAVRYAGAQPVFVDAEATYGQMNVAQVEEFLTRKCERTGEVVRNRVTGRPVRAILPVHVVGHPVDLEPLAALAKRFQLPLVEDATESLGTSWRGQRAGSWGDVACLSFNGNKIMTTGGGGMILTRNQAWAARARYLTTQAKDDPVEYVHHEVGYNYRLTNIQAAFGCAQMEALAGYVQRRREIHALYLKHLGQHPGLQFQGEAEGVKSNCWLTTVRVDATTFGMTARELRDKLKAARIEARPLWQPGHLSPAHQDAVKLPCPVAEGLYQNCLSLPSCSSSSDADIERVISVILG